MKYESELESVFGPDWKHSTDRDGIWGVVIIKSVADGTSSNLKSLSKKIDVNVDTIADAYHRLSINGCFLDYNLKKDKKNIQDSDLLALCYYAGIASGVAGNVDVFAKKTTSRETASPSV